MSQNLMALTRSGQRILDYLMVGNKRTREDEGTDISTLLRLSI